MCEKDARETIKPRHRKQTDSISSIMQLIILGIFRHLHAITGSSKGSSLHLALRGRWLMDHHRFSKVMLIPDVEEFFFGNGIQGIKEFI